MIKLQPIPPIGQQTGVAFVCPGGLREVTHEVFPEDAVARGRALRDVRVLIGRSLGDTARMLGLRPSQLSNVEMGRADLLISGECAKVEN